MTRADRAAIAKAMRAEGRSYQEIGAELGVGKTVVYEYLRPPRKKHRDAVRQPSFNRVNAAIPRADITARLAEIPEDCRGLTARLCGDPIPNDPRRRGLS